MVYKGKPTLAKVFDPEKHDITKMLMSEKFDGVRSIWDGKNFRSRTGKIYQCPQHIKNIMPKSPLDGELWKTRNTFEQVSGQVRRHGDDWSGIKYKVFDVMHNLIINEPYTVRYSWLKKVINHINANSNFKFMSFVKQYKFSSFTKAKKTYDKWVSKGAEGAMLRYPQDPYINGRTDRLLKWKPVRDMEAKIIGFNEGEGKNAGKLGTFSCLLIDDKTKKVTDISFKLSGRMTDVFRSVYTFKDGKMNSKNIGKDYPVKNSIVTFTYMTLSKYGVPRQPIYMRIRKR